MIRPSKRLLQAVQIYEPTPSSCVGAFSRARYAVRTLRRPVTLSNGPTVFAAIRSLSASHATSRSIMTNSVGEGAKIVFAADQPDDLPGRLSKLSAWTMSPSNMGITRQFTFRTFSAAWKFMTLVADESKVKKHHPHWSNLYNQVSIEWTTHQPKGLSIKDVEMAEFCDKMADQVGLKA